MQDSVNATKAAQFLGVSRQRFYRIKRSRNLKPVGKKGIVSYYGLDDLRAIRQAMDVWLVKIGKLPRES